MTVATRQIEHGGGRSFRWRVLIAVPAAGFGGQLAIMRGWLDQACGPVGWVSAPAGLTGIVNDAVAFYFADRDVASAFVARFCCGYRLAPPLGL